MSYPTIFPAAWSTLESKTAQMVAHLSRFLDRKNYSWSGDVLICGTSIIRIACRADVFKAGSPPKIHLMVKGLQL